jgi:hypothetical protein
MSRILVTTITIPTLIQLPNEQAWPGCETMADVIKMMERQFNNGEYMVEDLLSDNMAVSFTGLEV